MQHNLSVLKRVITRGGPGSGHHGHAGRPSKVGGSLPGRGNTKTFVSDFIEQHNNVIRNPISPAFVAIFDDEGVIANIEMTPIKKAIRIDSIFVPMKKRGQGLGTVAMKLLMGFAIEKGITLIGSPKPFGQNPPLGEKALIKWYQRLGFELDNGEITFNPFNAIKRHSLPVTLRGGPGSGHHGHKGRPGERGGSLPGKGGGKKHVGLTSARPGREAPEIIKEDMREFEEALRDINGVSNVTVEFGEGGWEGGSEPTWVISFDGNGDALSLIAGTGKKFNQDGVLLYESCNTGCSPVVNWTFGDSISLSERDAIEDILVERGIGGWTWYNDSGQTALRAISVPQWGGDSDTHLSAAELISESFSAAGLNVSRADFDAKVTVMEEEGENAYDAYLD